MNTTKTSRAVVTPITIMGQQFEGAMLPDGSYKITIQQGHRALTEGLSSDESKISVYQTHAHRDLKTLLGKDSSLTKEYVDNNSVAQNCLTIAQFWQVIRALDRKGNPRAQAFVDACGETTLAMYFDLAFGVERTTRERVTWNEVRAAGIEVRKSMTDGIRDHYLARGEHAEAPVYIRITEAIHQAGLGFTAKEYKQAHNLPTRTNMRPLLDKKQLHRLTFAEDLFLARLARTGDITIALRQTQNTLA